MLLISKKKKNHNRFLTKFYCENNKLINKNLNVFKFKNVSKSLRFLYFKKKKFYKKKGLKFKNKIYKIIFIKNFLVNAHYSILLEKPTAYSNCVFGLVKFYKYLKFNYLLKKKNYLNATSKLKNSFGLLPLFYGYKTLTKIKSGSYFYFNKFFLLNGSLIYLFLAYEHLLIYYLCISNRKRYASAAGTYCLVLSIHKENNCAIVKLPSGVKKKINFFFSCIVGRSANIFSKYRVLGKASSTVFLKKKKINVRGVAMNPVDHPNGGRTKVKSPFKSPWGWIAKKTK